MAVITASREAMLKLGAELVLAGTRCVQAPSVVSSDLERFVPQKPSVPPRG